MGSIQRGLCGGGAGSGVLDTSLIDQIDDFLSEIRPMRAAFDPNFVKKLDGDHIIPGGRKEWAAQLRADIRQFKATHNLERVMVIWCGSTEAFY